ncbi:hypothetical protein HanIR_Chr05g0244531 [Helianthus annuus]|nr:hypothetical protein HanIR_Chr05g0244531 [Helianthus annuus]
MSRRNREMKRVLSEPNTVRSEPAETMKKTIFVLAERFCVSRKKSSGVNKKPREEGFYVNKRKKMICVIKRTCSVCRRREKEGPDLCDQKDRKTLVVLCESIKKKKKENLSDSSICVRSLKRKKKEICVM